jgi:hypothetical protein
LPRCGSTGVHVVVKALHPAPPVIRLGHLPTPFHLLSPRLLRRRALGHTVPRGGSVRPRLGVFRGRRRERRGVRIEGSRRRSRLRPGELRHEQGQCYGGTNSCYVHITHAYHANTDFSLKLYPPLQSPMGDWMDSRSLKPKSPPLRSPPSPECQTSPRSTVEAPLSITSRASTRTAPSPC